MDKNREPFQGVVNIIRFNWHFYLVVVVILTVVLWSIPFLSETLRLYGYILSVSVTLIIIVSLAVSHYIYDRSDLYELSWLDVPNESCKMLNLHAGFDETSQIIRNRFPGVELTVADFYDPIAHPEISIKRARRLNPPEKDVVSVSTRFLPFSDHTFDIALAILSAHEIRNEDERVSFLNEVRRVTKQNGNIWVTEHLRDWNNLLVYNIGYLHFHSRASWLRTFTHAGLQVKREIKVTPFVTTFLLQKNGNPY